MIRNIRKEAIYDRKYHAYEMSCHILYLNMLSGLVFVLVKRCEKSNLLPISFVLAHVWRKREQSNGIMYME